MTMSWSRGCAKADWLSESRLAVHKPTGCEEKTGREEADLLERCPFRRRPQACPKLSETVTLRARSRMSAQGLSADSEQHVRAQARLVAARELLTPCR